MKQVCILLAAVLLFSCKKENSIRRLQQEIAGSWELERFIGFPFSQPVYPPGNGKIIVLDAAGSFTRMQHDTLMYSGSYHIEKKKDCYPRDNEMAFFSSENSGGTYQYIATDSGKLVLSTPNCYMDGGTTCYRRIK